MNTSEIEELFAQTLLGDYEGDDSWAAVSKLRQNASREVFERAAIWCEADDTRKRARAVAILCQLRRSTVANTFMDAPEPERMFRDEAYSLVTGMLLHEEDPLVLDSAISALGHLDNPKAIPLITRYHDHADQNVRFAVAFALACFPDDEQSVCTLLKLTSDPHANVRDWAVFGLGVLGDADSPDIREALWRCLVDTDENVREEAAVGLGKRHDRRVIPKLLAMLDEPVLASRVAEAAAALMGLDSDTAEWLAADYKAALLAKFQTSD